MTRKEVIDLAGVGGLLAILAAGFIAYGRFTDRLDEMDRRITVLEKSAQPGTKLADICLQLITEQSGAGDAKAVQDQMNRFHCYERVAADTRAIENATASADLNAADMTTTPTNAAQNR
jgi:hypothetical protein